MHPFTDLLRPEPSYETIDYLPTSWLESSPEIGTVPNRWHSLIQTSETTLDTRAGCTEKPDGAGEAVEALFAAAQQYVEHGSLAALAHVGDPSVVTNEDNAEVSRTELGRNRPGLLDEYRTVEATQDTDRVILSERGQTTVQAALTQNKFRLASVFDPSKDEDVSLFELDGSVDDQDSEESQEEDHRDPHSPSLNVGPSIPELTRRFADKASVDDGGLEIDDLDAELDEALGYGDAIKAAQAQTFSTRSRRKKRAASLGVKEETWGILDSSDVSDFRSLVPDPALSFPFELDDFQKRAIVHIENNEHVFVAAHTSAGKTAVAEYAIAHALDHRTKVVYTSPIKTLSNQKFRDFSERFGEVGLITGDISINPDAPIVIMTTEILRSMLYRGADLVRDLEWVVFDEVHWASDPERGVVWEEAIILLPEECSLVMLSATVPNALEFASWVGNIKRKPVHVVTTGHRPVPLVHSLFVKSEAFPLYKSSKPQFLSANFKAAAEKHSSLSKNPNVRMGGGRHHSTWVPMVNYLRKRELDPALIFCFSRRKCEEAAETLHSMDLTTGMAERNRIHKFFQLSMSRLSPEDQRVPQIARCRDMLRRGIGVHHAGILPLVREATEVLFQQGLVRILFCTETFAVGVNAPARTVVFSALRKFDGSTNRFIEPGEYVQMAGRAGRRGKDSQGNVFLYPVPADFPSEIELKSLLTGPQKRMVSQFRLTYNMILNLMRVDELRIEDVLSRSFSEAPAERGSKRWRQLVESCERQLEGLRAKRDSLDPFREVHLSAREIVHLSRNLSDCTEQMKEQRGGDALFRVGRVVLLHRDPGMLELCAIVSSSVAKTAKLGLRRPSASTLPSNMKSAQKLAKVAILRGGPATNRISSPFVMRTSDGSLPGGSNSLIAAGGLNVEMLEVKAEELVLVSTVCIDVDERGLNPIRGKPSTSAVAHVAEQLCRVAENCGTTPSLSTVPDLYDVLRQIDSDGTLSEMWAERDRAVARLGEISWTFREEAASGELATGLRDLKREESLSWKLDTLRVAASSESLQLMPDFRHRVEVLTRLDYVQGGSVLMKGRAMSEVNCCELILIELCFENIVQGMKTPAMVALLSSLVFQDGGSGDERDDTKLVDSLKDIDDDLYRGAIATRDLLYAIGTVQAECGLPVSPVDYVRASCDLSLAHAVYLWAQGKPFTEVCVVAEGIAEGTIVRGIVRLSELLREMRNVGKVIGDMILEEKGEEGVNLIRRDVIFAASLYVS